MGLLDPKLDKQRTFELLRKKGAIKAILEFDGGHDQGCVQSITLITGPDESSEDLPTYYCGGYGYDEAAGGWVPLGKPANEDEELADLLEGPINERFGSWGSVESTVGTLTWEVESETCSMHYEQSEYISHEETVVF
jgi:hypothetical protein